MFKKFEMTDGGEITLFDVAALVKTKTEHSGKSRPNLGVNDLVIRDVAIPMGDIAKRVQQPAVPCSRRLRIRRIRPFLPVRTARKRRQLKGVVRKWSRVLLPRKSGVPDFDNKLIWWVETD